MSAVSAAENESKEDPVALFEKFLTYRKAGEQEKAREIIDKICRIEKGALPLLPTVLKFIKDAPPADGGVIDPYRTDASNILGAIGAPAAIPLADMISEGAVVATSPLENADYRFGIVADRFDGLAFDGVVAVPRLIAALDSPSAQIRSQAARCLRSIGPFASAASPRLQRLCSDPDEQCRREALQALVRIETDSKIVLPHVEAALGDESENVWWPAPEIAQMLGEKSERLSDALVELLARSQAKLSDLPRGNESEQQAGILYDITVKHVVDALEVTGLGQKQCEALVDFLLKAQGTITQEARRKIAESLSAAGAPAHPAIKRWIASTRDADEENQAAAFHAEVLVRSNPLPGDIPAIDLDRAHLLGLKLIKSHGKREPGNFEGPSRSQMVGIHLVAISRDSQHASAAQLPEIAKFDPPDGAYTISLSFTYAFLLRGDEEPKAILWLIEQVSGTNKMRRPVAISTLGQLGSKAAAAIPALRAVVEGFDYAESKNDSWARSAVESAYTALAHITEKPEYWMKDAEARRLRPMLAADPRGVSDLNGVVNIFVECGPAAKPYLRRWITGDNPALAREAMGFVMHLGQRQLEWPESESLREILASPYFDVNMDYSFAQFVARAGPTAPAALDVLIPCVEVYGRRTDDSTEQEKLRALPWSRYSNSAPDRIAEILAAFRAMGKNGAKKVIPALIDLYEKEELTMDAYGPNQPLRTNIVETLRALGEDLGPLASKWVPRLMESLKAGKSSRDAILELGAYGPLASSAVPLLVGHGHPDQDTVTALEKIAPDDPRVRAMKHLLKFVRTW